MSGRRTGPDFELLFDDSEGRLRLDAMPRRDLATLLERDARLAVERIRPDVVLLPAISHNQDHEAMMRAGLVACRSHDPSAKAVSATVLLYE